MDSGTGNAIQKNELRIPAGQTQNLAKKQTFPDGIRL